MNRSELIQIVARKTNLDTGVVEDVLDNTIMLITLTLASDETVSFRGFGKFKLSKRPPVDLKNPRNGEPIHVEERRTAMFVPSTSLKERLNSDPLF